MNRNDRSLLIAISLGLTGASLSAQTTTQTTAPAAAQPAATVMTLLAGNGEPGFSDGSGRAAQMNKPIRLAPLNETTVVFADINNHAIRTVDLEGTVRTIAGGPDRPGHLDGPASEAKLNSPHGVAVRHDGVIAVAEASGNTIRLLTPVVLRESDDAGQAQSYTVTTLAGVPGQSGMKDGAAHEALFSAPHAVAWGARGELYVADIGNARLRMIEGGQVTTIAGGDEQGARDGALGTGTLKYPMDLAIDETGALWIADAGTLLIRRWRAGRGLDTPLKDLNLAMPHGLTVVSGTEGPAAIIVADMYTHCLLRFDIAGGQQITLAGTGEAGAALTQLNRPAAALYHAGRYWIADLENHRIVTCAPADDSGRL